MFGPWDPKTYEVEDSAMGFIKMKDGSAIQIEASWALNILDSRIIRGYWSIPQGDILFSLYR